MPKRVSKPKPDQFEESLRGTLAYNIRLLRFKHGISQEEPAFRCEPDRTYISAVGSASNRVSKHVKGVKQRHPMSRFK